MRAGRWSEICAVVVLALALVPIAESVLAGGFPYCHDCLHHLMYAYRFDHALHQGQFPVRWTEPLLPGRGQPLFNYYQVGFYYVASAVHEIVPRLDVSVKISILLLWLAGAAFMYMLCRRFGTLPAVAGAFTFVLSPYLIVDVFVRGAFPELAAFTFAIGGLLALDRFLLSGSVRFGSVRFDGSPLWLWHLRRWQCLILPRL